MDEIITNIVHISLAGVCCEVLYRISSAAMVTTKENGDPYWFEGGFVFLISYILCIITQLSGFKDITYISKSESFRSLLSILHGLDGFAALLIGVSLYYKSKIGLWLSLIMITKIFLIHLLNRLILAKKSDLGILAECTQTTKSYLHHVSSFLFISHPTEIIITTLWRTISMTGHATLVLRGKVSVENISKINWILAYMRILMVISILITCICYPDVRRAFGESAIGHISYMMVRLGPVYKTGSMYLNKEEKINWDNSTEKEKIYDLLTGKYLMFSIEVFLLIVTSITFAVLRISILFSENHMIFEHDHANTPLFNPHMGL